eukprot:m.232734 g.232734  ORF g.232734 m.232734 type:complete len:260 (-) comp13903_c0_seq14:1538-2317(-)
MSRRRKEDIGRNIVGSQSVDFDKLHNAVHSAIESEDKYWRENDAKFRAVNQKVGSYEEFEDIVKASHLKSIDEDITQLNLHNTGVNRHHTGRGKQRNRRQMLLAHKEEGHMTVLSKDPLPLDIKDIVDSRTFTLTWNSKQTSNEKYKLLVELGGKRIYHIFKPELPYELFKEFICVIKECLNLDDGDTLCKLIKAFCRTQRFSITRSFFEEEDIQMIRDIVESLDGKGYCSEDDRNRLRIGYPRPILNAYYYTAATMKK